MAQFDVHRNADPASRKTFPLLLDIQADILESLATRVVVPLAEVARGGVPITRLMPVFEVDGRERRWASGSDRSHRAGTRSWRRSM